MADYIRVNPLTEYSRFSAFCRDECLSANEVALWLQLFDFFNRKRKHDTEGNPWFPSVFIPIHNNALLGTVPMRLDAMIAARNRLRQRGLIDYIPGKRNKDAPMYRMNFFTPGDEEGSFPQPVEKPVEKPVDKLWITLDDEDGEESYSVKTSNTEDKTAGKTTDKTPGKTANIRIENTERENNGEILEEDGLYDDRIQTTRARESNGERLRGLGALEAMRYHGLLAALYPGADGERMQLLILTREYRGVRYTASLIARAIEKTSERHQRDALRSPIDYTLKVLEDWHQRGISTEAELDEALAGRLEMA